MYQERTNFLQVGEKEYPPYKTTTSNNGGGGALDTVQDMCEHYWMPYVTCTAKYSDWKIGEEDVETVIKVYCRKCLKIKNI